MQLKLTKRLSLNANKTTIEVVRIIESLSRPARELSVRLEAHATSIRNQATLRLSMLRRLAASKKFAVLGLSTAFALHEAVGRAPREVVAAVQPARIGIEDHWRRATGIIKNALAGLQRVKSLHAAATRQLDATDYALTQLLHDLRPVMGLPADVSGLRAVLAEAERTAPERYRKALAA